MDYKTTKYHDHINNTVQNEIGSFTPRTFSESGSSPFSSFMSSALGQGITGSFIQGGMGLLGSWLQNKWNRQNMALQQRYTQENMDKSNEIWQQQNATQVQNQMDLTRMNPILQKIGMQQAGMNVNGTASGNVASAAQGAAPSTGSVGLPQASNPFNGVFDIFGKAMELRIAEAQERLLEYQARNVDEDTEQKAIMNKWMDPMNEAELEATNASRDASLKMIEKYGKEMDLTDAQIQNLQKATSWIDRLNQAEYDKAQAAIKDLVASARKADAEAHEATTQAALNQQLSSESRAREEKTREETYGIKLENAVKEFEKALTQAGISPIDAGGYATQMRNIFLNPDAYGGVDKASRLIEKLMEEQRINEGIDHRYGNVTKILGTLINSLPNFREFVNKAGNRVGSSNGLPRLR